MFRKECSLCGGKLNGNVCTECGLDNSKSDEQYKTYGGHQEYDALTHVHDKVDPFAGKTLTKNQKKQMNSGTYRMNHNDSGKKQKGKGAKVVGAFVLISTVLSVIGAITSLISEIGYGSYEVYPEPEYEYGYDYIDYEFSETGEYYEVVLEPGNYKAGVHIPVGLYCLEVEEGQGSVYVSNDELGIYEYYWLNEDAEEYEDDSVDYVDEFPMYAGTRIEIQENVTVLLSTENADFPLQYIMNPNTEPVVVSDLLTVGLDVEPGVYDIVCTDGEGMLEYYIEDEEGYVESFGVLIGDGQDPFYPTVYKNIVLPQGSWAEFPEMTVRLVPSEFIESEEYIDYYE